MTKRNLKRTQTELIDELWEQIDNLAAHRREFSQGSYGVYKSMSVILRTVLTGSSGDSGLVHSVLPTGRFHRLNVTPIGASSSGIETPADIVVENDRGGKLHYKAGGTMPYLGTNGGGVVLSKTKPEEADVVRRTEVGNLFNVHSSPLPVNDWLAQPFLRPDWTIRTFIRCVAHSDGGAHLGANEQLRTMKNFGSIQRHLTAKIAEYVVGEVTIQLRQTYPSHTRIQH
ncbi:MAG: hypothetical protein JSU63_06675 [Phycisphaerales bacterium]|nr:MAG: hypothetical protein JSU63_06675 [Phycisphaerales bacterium]